MFNSITWEIFVAVALAVATGYYVVTTLLLYNSEFKAWIKSRSHYSAIPSPAESKKLSSKADVMGGIFQEGPGEHRTSSVSVDTLVVDSRDEIQEAIQQPAQNITTPSNDRLLVGSVADLLEEIDTLIQLVNEYKSSKTETQDFFHALFIRYPVLNGTTFQEAISLYVSEAARNQFSFELNVDEVRTWWTTSIISSKK